MRTEKSLLVIVCVRRLLRDAARARCRHGNNKYYYIEKQVWTGWPHGAHPPQSRDF